MTDVLFRQHNTGVRCQLLVNAVMEIYNGYVVELVCGSNSALAGWMTAVKAVMRRL